MKKYITLLLLLLSCTVSMAQIAVGIRLNNPLVYGSSISPLYNEDGEKIQHLWELGRFSIRRLLLGFLSKKSIGYYILNFYSKNEGTHLSGFDVPDKDRGPYYRESLYEEKKTFFPSNI